MVMEGDLTWGGEHTVQYADDVLQNCTSDNLYNFIKAKCASIMYYSKFQREFPRHHKLETEREVEHHHSYPQTIELIKHVFILLFKNI